MTRAVFAVALAAGCASSSAPDPGLEGLSLSAVSPGIVIPGTTIVMQGASFVDDQWGAGTLHLSGSAGDTKIDQEFPAKFVDFSTMTVDITADQIDALGGDVDFHGLASAEFVATTNGEKYTSDLLTIDLSFRKVLSPHPTTIVGGVIFVNDEIEVDGDGFLLGGNEGTTYAHVDGCFMPDGSGTCTQQLARDVPLTPAQPFSRSKAHFPFVPAIAGIKPGTFIGSVGIINKQSTGDMNSAFPFDETYTLVTSQIFSLDPPAASLGQYVFIHGGGFVGGEGGALTTVELAGKFNKTGQTPVNVTMQVIPEWVDGRLVRYVLNTDDTLGKSINLRADTGHFAGTATPIVSYGGNTVRGVSSSATFDIAPVKQIVYLNFQPAYVEELRDFGLRAVDDKVRARILQVVGNAYKGVNIEFRDDAPPTDFALFSNVDLVGVDPNNMGLFGYDNSPGKDDGNLRLYDQLGGVNATTQQDGYPGYGGVFVRSLLGFSKHPGSLATMVPGADPAFDKVFDPFRPDQSGSPVTSQDLAGGGPSALTDGSSCPASDRQGKIACAVFVMGNLIGGTLSHEVGHSLGLANPYADGFHDSGDQPNRLMDAGGDRPFLERAELGGQGPGVFCDDEYTYLRMILPSPDPSNDIQRPGCF